MYIRFKIILFLFFGIYFSSSGLDASPQKYTVSICAIFKNESKYLKEWIEYHRLIGVDHFYLYSCGSSDRYYSVLESYMQKGIVSLIHWPDMSMATADPYEEIESETIWMFGSQVSAYENACKVHARGNTKWLVFLDIDEFLLPGNRENLIEILDRCNEYPAVILSSIYYDASNTDSVAKNKLVIESMSITGSPSKKPSRAVQKTIFKPELCQSFNSSPFEYKFKGKKKPIKLSREVVRINSYLNRDIIPMRSRKMKAHIDPQALSEDELKQVLDSGYEIDHHENEIRRFIPAVLTKMNLKAPLD